MFSDRCICISYISHAWYLSAKVILLVFCEECKLWNYIRCSILYVPFVLSLLIRGVLLSFLFAKALSLFSSVRARNRISRSCSTGRKAAAVQWKWHVEPPNYMDALISYFLVNFVKGTLTVGLGVFWMAFWFEVSSFSAVYENGEQACTVHCILDWTSLHVFKWGLVRPVLDIVTEKPDSESGWLKRADYSFPVTTSQKWDPRFYSNNRHTGTVAHGSRCVCMRVCCAVTYVSLSALPTVCIKVKNSTATRVTRHEKKFWRI
jgi:hypothetical protein